MDVQSETDNSLQCFDRGSCATLEDTRPVKYPRIIPKGSVLRDLPNMEQLQKKAR